MFDTSEELTIFRETIHRAAKDKIAPLAQEIDQTGVFNREVEALCGELGLLTLTLPITYLENHLTQQLTSTTMET